MPSKTPEQEIADLKAQLAALELKIRKTPSCGSTSDCCHVGYAHRHCPHCNATIDTRSATERNPWQWPQMGPPVLANTGTAIGRVRFDNPLPNLIGHATSDYVQQAATLPAPQHACEVN